MEVERPEPPHGVRDLNSQPAIATDRQLLGLCDELEGGLSDDVFEDLSRWTEMMEDESPGDAEAYREQALAYVVECIEYREAIRPESLREPDELPDEVGRVTAGAWVWYHNGYEVEHSRPESDAKDVESGKYLLFASVESWWTWNRGLGVATVAEVAATHGCAVALTDTDGGARFEVTSVK